MYTVMHKTNRCFFIYLLSNVYRYMYRLGSKVRRRKGLDVESHNMLLCFTTFIKCRHVHIIETTWTYEL